MRAESPLELRVVVAISLGGGLGALLRYAVAAALTPELAVAWATFAANLTGCLAIGLLAARAQRLGPLAWPFLGTGLLGGYTTFSAYSGDTLTLAREGHWWLAAAYLVGTVIAALAAVALGLRAGRTS